MTLCTEILTIVNNLENVHATREDVPYDAVERLVIRLGPRLFRLTLITADVCTCYVDSCALLTVVPDFMQMHGATLVADGSANGDADGNADGNADGISSDIG